MTMQGLQLATLGGGCFWCIEAFYQQIIGIEKVVSGYAAGEMNNPTYQDVCTGTSGHAEVIQLSFNPQLISYADIIYIFWHIHDPTTKNRQGADIGSQYRSIILYHDEEQQAIAEKSKQNMDRSDLWHDPIVTEIMPFTQFFTAEQYHQNYYRNNPNQPYCTVVINPKMEKFRKTFANKLKA